MDFFHCFTVLMPNINTKIQVVSNDLVSFGGEVFGYLYRLWYGCQSIITWFS